jgi:hypothetical protein
VAGLAFVVTGLIAFLLPGAPPTATEVSKIGSYLVDKRSDILISDYVLGVAFAFFLLFLGSLRSYLGSADPAGVRPGAVLLGPGAAGAALTLAGAAVGNGAVFQVASSGDQNLNHALYDVSSDLFTMAAFPFAAFFVGAAVVIWSTRALPSALASAALVVALLNLVSGAALFAGSGAFAIGGILSFIGPLVSLLWILAVSVVLLRARAEPAPAT